LAAFINTAGNAICEMKYKIILTLMLSARFIAAHAQTLKTLTETYQPEPRVVTPARAFIDAPSDAIILFDGRNLDAWVSHTDTTKAAQWNVHDGVITVNKSAGDIQTRQHFTDYQLHIEWQVPADISGEGQSRGTAGFTWRHYLTVLFTNCRCWIPIKTKRI
jgi:hypothetical protein